MNDYIQQYYIEFNKYLNDFNKDKTLEYSMMLLSEGKVTIQELYEEIITPSLNSIVINRVEKDTSIWKEHLMSNIVRTVIECAYPFVLEEKKKFKYLDSSNKVIVLCPEAEYHDIGARMGADFYNILNYEVFFIGCNTPKENFISAITTLKPDIISISISNYLNLVELKDIIEEIKRKFNDKVMIVISGSAIKHTHKNAEYFGANAQVSTFADIKKLRGDSDETSI